jgi:hypothetical protein
LTLGLADVPLGEGWRDSVALVGPECISTRTRIEPVGTLLSPHYVSDLELKAFQGSELFWSQFAANLYLKMNSHPCLGCLRCGKVVYALFNEVVINRLCVQRLIQSDIGLTESSICHLALGFGFFDNHPNSLPLLGRQAELCDWVLDCDRWCLVLHGERRTR